MLRIVLTLFFLSPRCWSTRFTCVDCNKTFTNDTVHAHTSCVTEEQRWHGKFAKNKNQNGNKSNTTSNSNTPASKNINTTNNNNKVNTPSKTPETNNNNNDPQKDGSKKRKLEDSGSSQSSNKKQKVEEEKKQTVPNMVIDLEKSKWRRTSKRLLKKAPGKEMELSKLKEEVVNALLSNMRSQVEEKAKIYAKPIKKPTTFHSRPLGDRDGLILHLLSYPITR